MSIINWNAIDTVLLDMDGTLLDQHFDNYFWLHHLPRRYAERCGEPEEQVRKRLLERLDAERGSLNWYCLDFWTRELDIDIVGLKREVAHLVAKRPHVDAFLTQLQASGRDCLLVTNAHADSLAVKMDNVDLTPWFDHIVISHDYGAAKEDPRFWQGFAADFRFDPARTLMIDDSEAVLAAARRFGIAHVLTLLQPDSRRPHRRDLRFPAIHHFDTLLPVPARDAGGEMP